jgi:hypothetical protein
MQMWLMPVNMASLLLKSRQSRKARPPLDVWY